MLTIKPVGLIMTASLALVVAARADDVAPAAKPSIVVPERIIDPLVCADPTAGDCGLLIDNEKIDRRQRIAALLIRAKALVASHRSALALADYDTALKLDPSMTDVLNARGELRRATGDNPRALADFTAVLKIRPDHEQARDNRKSLSKDIERIGAEMAIGKKAAPPPGTAPLK